MQLERMALPLREEFIDCLRKSGLIEEDRLNRILGEAAKIQDVAALGQSLVDNGTLTEWQRDRLFEKRFKGYYLGKYRLLKPIGAGAMGSVFLGEHKVMHHKVAIKVLAKRLVAKESNVVRFEREARAAAMVNHPNIVRAFDIDRDGETHYLVMEFVEGVNLQKLIEDQGVLLPKVAADYIAQVARGLHEAHKHGMVHRDIKPANLLLDQAGSVKILDLGLARLESDDSSLTMQNESRLLGTVDYLAPEQAVNSHTIDGRADLYSLGCTLYFLLTGLPPFPSGSLTERILKHQTKRPLDIRKRRPEVPEALVKICNHMMEKQATRRFQTAGEAADALEAFCDDPSADMAFEEQNAVNYSEDGGLTSLAEDTSSGRSSVPGSRSTLGKSNPSLGAEAAKSSVSLHAPVPSKSPSGSKSSSGKDDLELDLSPLESDTPKKSAASKSPSGSSAGKSSVSLSPSDVAAGKSASGASKSGSEKKTLPALEMEPLANESLLDLEMPPLASVPGNALPELSLLDQLTPLDAATPAPAELGADTSLLNDPLAGNLFGIAEPLSTADPLAINDPLAISEPSAATAKPPSAEGTPAPPTPTANAAPAVPKDEGYPLWMLIGAGLVLSLALVGMIYLISVLTR
jgi:eukaryotic-like serine/threonine-protein kinase